MRCFTKRYPLRVLPYWLDFNKCWIICRYLLYIDLVLPSKPLQKILYCVVDCPKKLFLTSKKTFQILWIFIKLQRKSDYPSIYTELCAIHPDLRHCPLRFHLFA